MESAGIYWRPVHHVLMKSNINPYVVNPHDVKAKHGKKTDRKDSERIAHVFQHGLVEPSFVPEEIIQKLRLLTRSRARILRMIQSFKNNTVRILDEANIKIGAVASDPFGVSAMLMMRAIIQNPGISPLLLAKLARGRLIKKEKLLAQALTGFLSPVHINLLKFNLEMLSIFRVRVSALEEQILAMCKEEPLNQAYQILKSFPGMRDVSAVTILAEIGNNMSYFPSAQHLASWTAICPGNNESAGKLFSGKIRKGNAHLRRILVQVAWAAQRKKGSKFAAYFQRIARKRGAKKAIVALAHKILRIIYTCISRGELFQEEKLKGNLVVDNCSTATSAQQTIETDPMDEYMNEDCREWTQMASDKDEKLLAQVDSILNSFSLAFTDDKISKGPAQTEISGNYEVYVPSRKRKSKPVESSSLTDSKDKQASTKKQGRKKKE